MTRNNSYWMSFLAAIAITMPTSAQEGAFTAEARALYDQVIDSMREAKSLSWESTYKWQTDETLLADCLYRIWLRKPNDARVEVLDKETESVQGVLTIQDRDLYIHWPGGKPQFDWERSGPHKETYEKYRDRFYMHKMVGHGLHSIGHETPLLGCGMSMIILDPSTFHGYTDSLQPHLDGVRFLESQERVLDGHPCRGIEVSYMKGQRTWELWVSQEDSIPREVRQVVRVQNTIQCEEIWSGVRVNEPIQASLFEFEPGEDWKSWRVPSQEEGLLKPGQEVPDFELTTLDGDRIRLSRLRGQNVWLYKWRVGCPPCRVGMAKLEADYVDLADKGIFVLGVNTADQEEIAIEFLEEKEITFPIIVDPSDASRRALEQFEQYQGMGAVPMTYVIDREGRVVDAWYGIQSERARRAMKKLLR